MCATVEAVLCISSFVIFITTFMPWPVADPGLVNGRG